MQRSVVDQRLTRNLSVPLRMEFDEHRWEETVLPGQELSSFLLDLPVQPLDSHATPFDCVDSLPIVAKWSMMRPGGRGDPLRCNRAADVWECMLDCRREGFRVPAFFSLEEYSVCSISHVRISAENIK